MHIHLRRPFDRKHAVTRLFVRTTAAGLLVVGATAQTMTDAAVEAEIEFARGLASSWTFVDMAKGVLDDVASAGLSERMSENLALARCELYPIAARRLRDPKEINALLEEGMAAYEEYLAANQYASNREEAERGLVTMAMVYANSIDNALEEAVGEEAEALRTRKVEALQSSIRRTEDLLDQIRGTVDGRPTEAQQISIYALQLQKAQMYATVADTTGDAYMTEQAIQAFDNLALDAGSNTEIGLRASIGVGEVYLTTGQSDIALDYFIGTLEQVYPTDPAVREMEGFAEKLRGELELRFNYVELAMQGVQPAARQSGQLDLALDSAMFMVNQYRKQGFTLSIEGDDAMLEIAETLLDAGGFVGGDAAAGEAKWYQTEDAMKAEVRRTRDRKSAVEFALEMVNDVSARTARASTKIKAGKLLESINSRPDIEIAPNALFEAAQAKFVAEEFDAALEGYYAVLDRLPTVDPAERVTFAASAYNGIGETLRRMDRYIEAAMAYRQGLREAEDPAYNARNAGGFLNSMRAFGREPGVDAKPEYKALMAEAQDAYLRFSDNDDPGRILLTQARDIAAAGDLDGAIAKYNEIGRDMAVYDAAQVEIGYRLYQAKRFGEAFQHFKGFVDYSKNPDNAPTTSAGRDDRHRAAAKATYMLGVLSQALASSAYKKFVAKREEGDITPADRQAFIVKYQDVIDTLKDFPVEFGDTEDVLRVQAILADAYAKIGDGPAASAVVEAMIASNPDAAETGRAAKDVYFVYRDEREKLEADDQLDQAELQRVIENMAGALTVSNRIAPSPDYANLKREADLWMELGQWDRAKGKLEEVVQRFKDDATYGERVSKFVVPDLAKVLLASGERAEAKALLAPLVIGENALLSTESATRILANAIFGEVVGSGTKVQVVPGVGGTEEERQFLIDRLQTFENIAESKGDFCARHAAKFDVIFALHQWGKENDAKRDSAKRVMENYVSIVLFDDTQFTVVNDNCMAESVDPALRKEYGNDVLASRYRWLLSRVR